MDANGCWMGNWCLPNPDGTAVCPAPPPVCPEVVPVQCGADEVVCWGGMGADGCAFPDFCMEATHSHWDGIECPNFCPTFCAPEEVWCDSGMDANGCMLGGFCMEATHSHGDGIECQNFCPQCAYQRTCIVTMEWTQMAACWEASACLQEVMLATVAFLYSYLLRQKSETQC